MRKSYNSLNLFEYIFLAPIIREGGNFNFGLVSEAGAVDFWGKFLIYIPILFS